MFKTRNLLDAIGASGHATRKLDRNPWGTAAIPRSLSSSDSAVLAMGLPGPIPPELANLKELYLGGNELSGPIPPELGNLTNLTDLWLSFNELSGPIPPELGNLTNLTGLNLSNNEPTSPIPQSFLALDMLEVFDFEFNAGLCAPNTTEFVTWLQSIDEVSGPYCSASSSAPH